MQHVRVNMPLGVDPSTGKYTPAEQPAPHIDLATGRYVLPEAQPLPVDTQAVQINERLRPPHQTPIRPSLSPIPAYRLVPVTKPHMASLIPTNAQVIKFYKRSVHNKNKSIETGYAVWEDKDYVRISTAGEQGQVIDRPVTRADVSKYPDLWQAYSNDQDQVIQGTPLTTLFEKQPAKAANLRSVGITTVEQLAAANDTAISAITAFGFSLDDVKRAQQYLHFKNNEKEVFDLKQELALRDEIIARQAEKITELEANSVRSRKTL